MDLELVKQDYQKTLEQLSDPELLSNWDEFEKLSKKKKTLEDIINKVQDLENIKIEIEQNKTILTAENDNDLIILAQEELSFLNNKKESLEKELNSLLNKDQNTKEEVKGGAVIVEIRAGAGGDEAALFAYDLFKMYSKFGQNQNWKQKILYSHNTEIGGCKEITFELKNGNVYSKIKYEAGVHRVQRIPTTEKGGRIHTSTASVAVLLKPKKGVVKINPQDLRIDTFKSSGPGGQYVNKRETAIRITHIPSGIVIASQTERSLQQNKENALAILEAKLLEKTREEEEKLLKDKRKTQIGKAKRAEKIRTYNFPQNRITDHRVKKSWHNIESVMAGGLDPIVDFFQNEEKKAQQ